MEPAGRVVARVDRKSGVFVVEGMYAEPGAPADPALPAAIESLGLSAGAGSVSYARADGVRRILSMGESAGRSRRA